MINALGLLKRRRFLPLFTTQFLGAFNDNLFKQTMVLFATYRIFTDARGEQSLALATALSITPFILFSALAGQLADTYDKARIIRLVKTVEIAIMLVGASGLLIADGGHTHIGVPLMLAAVFLLGLHSTFFGPIKYAILPQHLHADDDVLGGTGLVEAGTYLAILTGTILASYISIDVAAAGVLVIAGIGWLVGRGVPAAPRMGARLAIDGNPFTSSWRLISATLHIPRLFLAICAISFFWTIGAVLIIIFPALVKEVLTTAQPVASLFTATLSVGIAIGSVVINTLLRGRISARYAPASVIAMGGCVVLFALLVRSWTPAPPGHLYDWAEFISQPRGPLVLVALLAIAVTGGMFVVPLYAFLTTTVAKDQTARTVAANNVVNSAAMAVGAVVVIGISALGASSVDLLFLVAAMCLGAAWLAQKLHRACDRHGLPVAGALRLTGA